MNRWAREGGDPFSDATWDAAWRTTQVDAQEWASILGRTERRGQPLASGIGFAA